jgi:phage terminase large subunit-like protein
MVLLPRDHGKSAYIAYRCAWEIVRQPDVRLLYVSSTANLAEKQLKAIKDILTSKVFQFYWPEYVNAEEGKREKWTSSEISIDHPKRKIEGIRDPTIFTGGLTTSLTGLHCDIAVLDDVVVQENAYTEEGRKKVGEQYSLLASIEGSDAREWVVGTRYHPKDLYQTLSDMSEDTFDKYGEITGTRPVYEVFERQVEDAGDGTGEFIWPRTMRNDGKWFGFNQEILARKKAQYIDKTQFRAQYYNDPNDASTSLISKDKFQYYDKKYLSRKDGHWYFKSSRLNVYAAIDFAFSTKTKADYTAIVVIGIDSLGNIYVLDIERLKTNKISEYYEAIMALLPKWDFRKLRAEVSVAQEVIVKDLKESYLKPNGISLSIVEHRPTRNQGTKEERMSTILEPRYSNLSIWHYAGGNCELLEEELTLQNPPHDDIKDALSSAIEIAVPPINSAHRGSRDTVNVLSFNSRFGGISH